ncbi:MAG TPA: hypothetical protein VK923_13510 [Euzebyales bacterium]|nr:hypothetical protein [Euzebyales bacterium]
MQKDGVTHPPPIDGNDLWSRSPDNDGGFLRDRAAAYYKRGAIPVGG